MPPLRALDAAFLAMERPNEPRHLGTVMLFDVGRDGPLTHRVVRDLVARRIRRMPSARRVVVESPLGLGRPRWEEEDVDLEVHVRAVSVEPGEDGGMSALADVVARAHARPLDRRRPLWELHVVEGLADDRAALYAKVHMAALDDTTGVDLMTGLLDEDPSGAATIEAADAFAEGAADPADLYERFVAPVPDQLRRAVGFPARLAERAARAVAEQIPGLTDTAFEVARRTPGLDLLGRFLPVSDELVDGAEHPTGRAPRLSFNAPIGASRCVAFATLATDDIRRLATDAGASFNKVVVGVCTGALRRWLLANDELPTSPIVAIVPVLVSEAKGGGSHIAGLTLALPTHVADPAARFTRARQVLATAKRRRATAPASLQQDVAMFAPPIVAAATNRLMDALPHRPFLSPTVNLAVTNVPGPRRPVYLAGRPLRSGHPVLSVSDLTPLHMGVQPGPERTGLGAIACRDHVEELWSLVGAGPIELDELRTTFRPRRRRTSP